MEQYTSRGLICSSRSTPAPRRSAVPGRKFWMYTSASRMRRRKSPQSALCFLAGALLFLEQMGDEPRGARKQRHTLQGQQRITGIQEHRRNRSGDVERERTADDFRQEPLDDAGNLRVVPRGIRLDGHLEQALCAGISAPVQRMAIARDRLLGLAVLAQHLAGRRLE